MGKLKNIVIFVLLLSTYFSANAQLQWDVNNLFEIDGFSIKNLITDESEIISSEAIPIGQNGTAEISNIGINGFPIGDLLPIGVDNYFRVGAFLTDECQTKSYGFSIARKKTIIGGIPGYRAFLNGSDPVGGNPFNIVIIDTPISSTSFTLEKIGNIIYYKINGSVEGQATLSSDIDLHLHINTALNSMTLDYSSSGFSNTDSSVLSNSILATGTSTENYIRTSIYQVPSQSSVTCNRDIIQNIVYYDGLGRPKQSQIKEGGGNKEDLITPIVFDDYGRPTKEFLAYPDQSGSSSLEYRNNNTVVTNLNNYYLNKYPEARINPTTINAYSETLYEDSPLRRVLKEGAPGKDWEINHTDDTDHVLKYDYQSNTLNTSDVTADNIARFSVIYPTNNKEEPKLVQNGHYGSGELFKTIVRDENWSPTQQYDTDHTVEEFKDKLDRLILKRTFNKNIWHDTYYVYDDFGNLSYVIAPKANTYASILQSYASQNGESFENITSLYDSGIADYENELYIGVNPSSGYLYFEFYEYGQPEVPFDDGLVLTLNFNPPLPDIHLGEIPILTDTGDWESGAEAYISNGNLYFDSEGIDVYEAEAEFSIDLSAYQSTYNNNFDTDDLDEIAYQYKYDQRNRLIEKKIPGKDWEYIIYDHLDRPILTQDGNLRDDNEWLFTKYDNLGRILYTGLYESSLNRSSMQNTITNYYNTSPDSRLNERRTASPTSIANDPTTTLYYSVDASFPFNIEKVFTINYYDNYNWDIASLTNPGTVFGASVTNKTTSLETGSKIRILDTNLWVTKVNYYDNKARPIYQGVDNDYLNVVHIVTNDLDFTGKVLKTVTEHTKASHPTVTVEDFFTYDHRAELLTQTQSIDGGPLELISKNHYDERGQLIQKDIGHSESSPLQQVDYSYNIRGWLRSINQPDNLADDLFSFTINYQNPEGPTTSTFYNNPLYNGNISHTMWRTDNVDNALRHYSYRHDAMNRFERAFFAENDRYNNKFNTYVYDYDRNGNIQRLYRSTQNPSNPSYGLSMDFLTYTYNEGNKLLAVKDNYTSSTVNFNGFLDGNTIGDDYGYDNNGNMTKDKNKELSSIQYNHMNLPKRVSVDFDAEGYLEYTYDANGMKLSKSNYSVDNGFVPVTTKYAGDFVYEENSLGEELKFFNHPEGYVEKDGADWKYTYQYKDHLGNIRLSYQDTNNDGEITGASTEIFFEDFESASGWDSTGALYGTSLDYDGQHTRSGNYAGKLHSDVNAGIYSHSNNWIPINNTVPTDYIISGWVYSNGPGARFLLFMNEDTETTYYTLVESTNTTYLENRWVYLEKRVTVPTNIDKINFRVDLFYSGSGTVWYDNLSIRLANDNADMEIVEENNYYPFGLKHKVYNSSISGNEYKYKTFQGQEISEELGYNMLEFKFRHYDPAIARFVAIDPLAEEYNYQSPYNFSENRIIDGFELEGLERIDFRNDEVKSMYDYFKQNSQKYRSNLKYDDCITCHNKGMRVLLNNNNVPVGSQADITRSRMQNAGFAGETHTIGFSKADGSKAITPGQVANMDGSVAATALGLTGDSQNSVFGVSLIDGYHTMTLTVTNTEITIPIAIDGTLSGSPDSGQTITITTFTLSDQGTRGGTNNQGNLTFNSAQALDNHLTNYVRNASHLDFPAKIEIHQIQEPEE